MEQRRLVAFFSLSMLVFAVHFLLFPPERPEPPKNVVQEQGAEQQEGAVLPPREVDSDEEVPQEDRQAADPQQLAPAADVGLEYITLGSVDEESPYRLLVTLTNSGAGVRRVELASSRFRDLHDRGGYIGNLELKADEEKGLLIQAVGAGTPADKAGIKVGDRIVSLTSRKTSEPVLLETPEKLKKLLSQTKPRRELTLQVQREGGDLEDVVLTLGRRPLEVLRPESENVAMRGVDLPKNFPAPPSFQLTFERILQDELAKEKAELKGVTLRDSNWEVVEKEATSVTFRRTVPQHNLEVFKKYSLEPIPADKIEDPNYPAYDLKLTVRIRNVGSEETEFAYRLDGPNGLPLEGWWYANKIGRNWGGAGIRDVVAEHVGNDTVEFSPTDIAKGEVEPMQGSPLVFVGIDAQYFSAVLMPNKADIEEHWIDEVRTTLIGPKPKARSAEGRYANVSCRLISQPLKLAGGKELEHSYDIFTGPKRPDLLAQYAVSGNERYTLSDLMYYGWFSTVSKAMLSILHFFYGIVGNYGISIIFLTVLVRSCMFPISRKQAQSMAKMQELKPEMDKIKEKYKNDTQKQAQAMQDMYRKHQINPVAGCLPMFLQLPIFLGLYRSLAVDVELRQAPLLGDAISWCSNLAAPDMLFDWSGFMPDFVSNGQTFLIGLGPFLNVLPLVTVSLFILQQKMFMPEATTEQAALQQKIMKYMMLMMGFLFYKVASGLCLYFIASSIWGIAERKLLPKPTAASEASSTTETGKKPEPKTSTNGQPKSKRFAATKEEEAIVGSDHVI